GDRVQRGRRHDPLLLRLHRKGRTGRSRGRGRAGCPGGHRVGQPHRLLPVAGDLGSHDDGADRGVTMKRLLGFTFVLLLSAAVGMSVLTYRKAFTPVTWVTLTADHTGLQLNDGAEVKLHGVEVGEVRSIASDGQRATLRLALNPRQAALIPSNVTASMLPKTLF